MHFKNRIDLYPINVFDAVDCGAQHVHQVAVCAFVVSGGEFYERRVRFDVQILNS
jgi:hypothetical protein